MDKVTEAKIAEIQADIEQCDTVFGMILGEHCETLLRALAEKQAKLDKAPHADDCATQTFNYRNGIESYKATVSCTCYKGEPNE